MQVDEAKLVLEQSIAKVADQSSVYAYWQTFNEFCSWPIDNGGQAIVLTCLTADFPLFGHAFYITFKRVIWSFDDEDKDETLVDQITCSLACSLSAQTQGLNVSFGGEPLSDLEYIESLETIESLLQSNRLLELTPIRSSVYVT